MSRRKGKNMPCLVRAPNNPLNRIMDQRMDVYQGMYQRKVFEDPIENCFASLFSFSNRSRGKDEYFQRLMLMKSNPNLCNLIQQAIFRMPYANDVENFLAYYRRRFTFGNYFEQCSNAYFDYVRYDTYSNDGLMIPLYICVYGFSFKANNLTPIFNYIYLYKRPSVDGDLPFVCVTGYELRKILEENFISVNLNCPPTKQGYKTGSKFEINWFGELTDMFYELLRRPNPAVEYLNQFDYSDCDGYNDGFFHGVQHYSESDLLMGSPVIPSDNLKQLGRARKC